MITIGRLVVQEVTKQLSIRLDAITAYWLSPATTFFWGKNDAGLTQIIAEAKKTVISMV